LILLKQWHFQRWFHHWYYCVCNFNICKLKIQFVNWNLIFKNYNFFYFLIVQERKTNLHWVVEIPLGNVLPSVYIFALNEPPLTRRHCTRRVCIERDCLYLKCLFMIDTSNSWLLKALLEELATLLFVWCTIDFPLGNYTN